MSGRKNPDQPRYVVGHGLQDEGQAFDAAGRRIAYARAVREGRGKCACGALSDPLSSVGARKQWHVQHKADVLAAREVSGER